MSEPWEDSPHLQRACSLGDEKIATEAAVEKQASGKMGVTKNEFRANSRYKTRAKEEGQRGEEEAGLSCGSLPCLVLNC